MTVAPVTRRSAVDGAGGMIGGMPSRVSSPSFVGRREELQRLDDALHRAASGDPALVVLGGDAGVGKTRMLGEFAARATAGGALVVSGGCVNLGGGALPFAPFAEALRTLVRTVGAQEVGRLAGDHAPHLRGLVPELGEDAAGDAADQRLMFEAVLRVFERLGERSPVVLALEDLHWADRSSLDLIAFVAHTVTSERLLIVTTHRADELHRKHPLRVFLGEIVRLSSVERVDLSPFTRDELAEQLGAILGVPVEADVLGEIEARSEGNAFYAEELLAARVDGVQEMPPTLRDILSARVAALPDAAREILRVAAAAGYKVDHRLLEMVADLPVDVMRDALREAVSQQVLIVEPDGRSYRFRHALVQEAIHDDLLPGERTDLHGRVAEAIAADAGLAAGGPTGVDAELAHHWHLAYDLDRAFRSSLAAAAAAAKTYAYAEAMRHYDRAVELWDRVSEESRAAAGDRYVLLRAAGDAASNVGDTRRSIAYLEAAITAFPATGAREQLAVLHELLGRFLWHASEYERALELSYESVRLLPDEPSHEAARVLASHGRMLMLRSAYQEAIPVSRRAVEMARTVGSRQAEAQALNSLGTSTGIGDDADAGAALLREALALSLDLGDQEDILRLYINLTSVLEFAGSFDEALEEGRAGLAWADERGITSVYRHFLAGNMLETAHRAGRWDEAERLLTSLQGVVTQTMTKVHVTLCETQLRLSQGRLDDAREALARVQSFYAGFDEPQFSGPMADLAAELAAWDGRYDDVQAAVRDSLQLTDQTGGAWISETIYATAARAAADHALQRRRHDEEDADAAVLTAEALAHVAAEYARRDAPSEHHGLRLAAQAAIARAEARRGMPPGDPGAWMAAVAAAEATGLRNLIAYTLWRHGEALLDTGDRAAAAIMLRRAHDMAAQLGAGAVRDAVAALARRARIDIGVPLDDRRAGSGADVSLTTREREVLALVAAGCSNRQIGEALFISDKTASVHVSNILAKLEVTSRGEAAAVAHRLGIVT